MFSKYSIIFTIAVACIVIHSSQAWVMSAIYHHKDHPGKCYVNENIILSPGEKAKSPEGCSETHCRGNDGSAQVIGCGSVMPPKNCKWDGYLNVNAAFPICCVEKYKCETPADEIEAKKLQDNLKDMYTRQLKNE